MMPTGRASMLVVNGPPKEAYSNVLVPIDFSAESEAAVPAALAIAPEASITLLHAYDVPFEGLLRRAEVAPSAVEDLRLEAHADALSRLYGIATRYSWPARRFRSVAVRGTAARAILNEALESGTDLIAMARRSRSLLERLFIGSVTRRVLAETQSDVLIANLVPASRVPS
jgi:nucleotide-binding universal stress UspA family protein